MSKPRRLEIDRLLTLWLQPECYTWKEIADYVGCKPITVKRAVNGFATPQQLSQRERNIDNLHRRQA